MRYLVGGMRPPSEQQTVRVLMLRDAWGAPDGITRTFYAAGEEYDLPADLAGCFFSTSDADPAEAHMQAGDAAQEPLGAPEAAGGAHEGAEKARGARRAKFGAAAGG